MNAINKIIESLNTIFAPMDAKVLVASQEWAKERQNALHEFLSSKEYADMRGDAWGRYERLYSIAGGKTWYNVFYGHDSDYIESFITKNCAKIAANRNAKIAAKLTKSGVTEVISESFTNTNDGFNGVFIVNTDAGQKRVTIDTVYAGGYNVQCLHLRVLVKVK